MTRRTSSPVWTLLRLVGYTGVLLFLGWQVWRVRDGLADSLRTVGWGPALAAGVLAAVGGVPGFFGWRMLLTGLGSRLSLRDAGWVFFLGGLARYVPGGIWPTVAHAALARPLRQPPARLAAAFLVSQGLGVVSGLVVGVLALPWLVDRQPWWWLLLPVVLAAVAPLAAPSLLARLLGVAARVLRRGGDTDGDTDGDTAADAAGTGDGDSTDRGTAAGGGADAGRPGPPPLPDRRTLLGSTALMFLGWLVSGLHVTVLAVALGADPVRAGWLGVGGFALSVVAGIAAVVMPTGLGVREVALAGTLAALLTGPDLVTLVALSRVLLTVGDVGSTAVVLGLLVWTRRSRPADQRRQPQEPGVRPERQLRRRPVGRAQR